MKETFQQEAWQEHSTMIHTKYYDNLKTTAQVAKADSIFKMQPRQIIKKFIVLSVLHFF